MPVLGSRKISAPGKLSHAVSPPTIYGVYLKAIFLRRVEVPDARTKMLEARVGFEPPGSMLARKLFILDSAGTATNARNA
jgi:hypothetical protein